MAIDLGKSFKRFSDEVNAPESQEQQQLPQPACNYCGGDHAFTCPRVKRIHYMHDGRIGEIEFHPPVLVQEYALGGAASIGMGHLATSRLLQPWENAK